jgi:hypothetical protein
MNIQTYLYIKRHSITGKLYFGKTTRKDPVKYNGSGVHWSNHINKHGKEHVETIWYCLFVDQEECTKFALMCSEQWDIVNSEDWLNQVPECGIGGAAIGHVVSQKSIEKLIERNKTRVHSEETRQKLSLACKGKPKSEKMKKNLSIAKLGTKRKPFSIEWKQNMSNASKGKPKSAETRKKMSEANRDYIHGAEWKESHASAMKARIGKVFITDGVQNRLVTLEEANNIQLPWKRGMTKS